MNLTNQQIAFARVQLEAGSQASSPLSRRAHWQAGVFQLSLALECYARELQEQNKIRDALEPGPKLFSHLSKSAQAVGKICMEAEQLAALEADPSSWLSRLWRWKSALISLGLEGRRRSVLAETSLTEAEKQQAGVIELVDLGGQGPHPSAFSEELLRETLNAFTALLERQRDDSAEF